MKTKQIIATVAVFTPFIFAPPAKALDLTALQSLACEATLCLSTGSPPTECNPSLKKYFSIVFSKPWKTIQARKNFLKLCPDVTEAKASKVAADSVASDPMSGSSDDTGKDTPDDTNSIATNETDTAASKGVKPTPSEELLPREQIQAALDTLKPAWSLQAKQSVEARGVLERCMAQQGAAARCEVEQADYDAKRVPAITLRNEVARLESMLAKANQ